MIKIPITYVGFDNKEITKDFWFNLTKAEIAELQCEFPGYFEGYIERLKHDADVADVVAVFKALILKSYGKRTKENKFVKSKEYSEEFAASDAYSELFIKFLDDENDFVSKFLEGALNATPAEVQKAIEDAKTANAEKENDLPDEI